MHPKDIRHILYLNKFLTHTQESKSFSCVSCIKNVSVSPGAPSSVARVLRCLSGSGDKLPGKSCSKVAVCVNGRLEQPHLVPISLWVRRLTLGPGEMPHSGAWGGTPHSGGHMRHLTLDLGETPHSGARVRRLTPGVWL